MNLKILLPFKINTTTKFKMSELVFINSDTGEVLKEVSEIHANYEYGNTFHSTTVSMVGTISYKVGEDIVRSTVESIVYGLIDEPALEITNFFD